MLALTVREGDYVTIAAVGDGPACIREKRRQEAAKGPNYRRTRVLR